MCSIDEADVVPVLARQPWDEVTDEVWESELAEAHAAAERHPWGRFVSLYGDDSRPLGEPSVQPSDDELLRRMADAEALVTQLNARQGRDLLELRRRRLADQARAHPDHRDPSACTQACCDADGWVGLEVAQALAVSERVVSARIETAQRLDRYVQVAGACADGLLQSWTATKLLEHLDALDPYLARDRHDRVEAATVAWLLDRPRTVGQLNARMRRMLLAARAAAAAADRDDGSGRNDPQHDAAATDARDRLVRVSPVEMDGLATVIARLPELDALAIDATVRALAATPVAEDDTRTQEQRRCDLVTTLVTGVPAAFGHQADLTLLAREAGQISVSVSVTIPADTLSGGDAPAEVTGFGPVSAEAGRSLTASDATTTRPLVYDRATGRLLGVGSPVPVTWLDHVSPATGYRHPPSMERLLQLRDGACRAPGCARRAARCDCDHVVPYPDGPTSVQNTCCLCRRHHRLKTHAPGWSVRLDGSGELTWTTPTGRRLVTNAHDYSAASGTLPPSSSAPASPSAASVGPSAAGTASVASTDPPF